MAIRILHECPLWLGLETSVSTLIGWLLAGIAIGLVYKPVYPLSGERRFPRDIPTSVSRNPIIPQILFLALTQW